MGRFAFGWPKNYGVSGPQANETVRAIRVDPKGRFMMTLTDTGVLLWAARLHRVLVGHYSIPNGEKIIGGCWGFQGTKIAIAGSNGSVWVLQITECALRDARKGMLDFETANWRSTSENGDVIRAEPILPVVFKLVEEIRMAHAGSLTCIEGCVVGALVGTSKGNLGCVSWDGDVLWRIHVPELLTNRNALLSMGVVMENAENHSMERNISRLLEAADDDRGGAIVSLCYKRELDLCGVVTSTGLSFILSMEAGGASSPNAVNGRWLRSTKSKSIDIEPFKMIAAIGLSDGDVEQFYIGAPPGKCCPVVRVLSLSGWYFEPADVGSAKVVSWAPDGTALAVGWEKRGLAVWSVSGCRLMWTLPQVGGPIPTTPALSGSRIMKLTHAMDQGVTAMSWSPFGYFLWAASRKTIDAPQSLRTVHFVQFSFYKSPAGVGSCQNESTRLALLGADRILLLEHSETGDSQTQPHCQPRSGIFGWRHLLIPHDCLWRNFPPCQIAVSDAGTHIAVAGSNGIGICHIRSQRWRFFGDLEQGQRIRCCSLSWYGRSLIIGNQVVSSRGTLAGFRGRSHYLYELLFYSQDDLNFSSLQARVRLPARPVLLDVRLDGYLVVLCEESLILMYKLTEYHNSGSLTVQEACKLPLSTVKVPLSPRAKLQQDKGAPFPPGRETFTAARIFPPRYQPEDHGASKQHVPQVPCQVMLLKSTGLLLLLDLKQAVLKPLLHRVEQFWYTPSKCPPFDFVDQRPLWWAYGDEGVHVGFRDNMQLFLDGEASLRENGHSTNSTQKGKSSAELYDNGIGIEQWFELDPEVYPLGLMPKFGMILGVTQGLLVQSVTGDGPEIPSHVIKIKRQPVLHTLLRHLLMKPTNDDRTVLKVALRSISLPQFVDSLEWLLYEAVLDHDYSTEHIEQGNGTEGHSESLEMANRDHENGKYLESENNGVPQSAIVLMSPGRGSNLGLFPRVIRLLKYFGEYEDIVVRCARKMDSKRWPLLFSLAGEPVALLEQCFVSGRLRTAACLLVILQEMWGFISSTPHSLRLLDAALERGALGLASDLIKFLSKADQADMLNSSQLRTSEDVSWISEAKRVPRTALESLMDAHSEGTRRFPAVDLAVLRHTRRLLYQMELRKLGALAVRMDFPLAECIRRECGTKKRSRPFVHDFGSAILSLHRQFQWPEHSERTVKEAIRYHETRKADTIVRSNASTPLATNRMKDDHISNDAGGSTLLSRPSSSDLKSIRVEGGERGRQELEFLLRVSVTAGAADLTLCLSTLLLEIATVSAVLESHDEMFEVYVNALKEFNTRGYENLASYLEKTFRTDVLADSSLVAPIEHTTL